MPGFTFNCNEAPEPQDFSPLEPGEYPAMIIDSGIDEKKNGTEQVWLQYEVIDGASKGRKIRHWYTVKCANEQAVEIGLRQLRNVCESMGLAGITQTEELHDKPLVIVVGFRKDDKERNEVKNVKPFGSVPPAAEPAAQSPQSEPAARPKSAGKKPWEN